MSSKPLILAVATLVAGVLARPASGQPRSTAESPGDPFAAAVAMAASTAKVAEQPATLVYVNRPVVEFRATVLGRNPAARAASAIDLLNRLVDDVPAGRVGTRGYAEATVVSIGGHVVFAILSADVDPLAGEDRDRKAADAAARLQLAFDEAVELRTPGRFVAAALLALLATVLYGLALWLLIKIDRRVAARLSRTAERELLRLPGGEVIAHAANAPAQVRRAFVLLSVVLGSVMTYAWLTFVLNRFPYTRPWGESFRSALISTAGSAGRAVVDELPNLAAVLVIVVLTRFFVRLTTRAFRAVEEGRVVLPGIYPETALPTRRIAVALLWLFALILSYGYLPGSGSEAFKGVSVFVGLIVSLGSTGVMNQVMSGLMITYSRGVRVGDFVKIGDIEGTVTQLGTLATKIMNARNEEITIPNAIVVSHAATNYSRHAESGGVFAPTSVTIGYDTPWRQVQALLLLAAGRTPGVRAEPPPIVLQTRLEDHYVQYTLLVCLEQPHRRYLILDALHANIQDAFNEYGVQIMSPSYEADPSGPKVVPPGRWYAAPAAPPRNPAREPVAADNGDAASAVLSGAAASPTGQRP